MAPSEALSIASVVKEAIPFIGGAGVFALFIFSWLRAGSAHFLRERIWSITGGGKGFHDPYLSKQWNNVLDLERARYRTGIRFQSKSEVEKTFEWLDKYEIPLDDLLKSARYFDKTKIAMKDPELKKRNFLFAFEFILLIVLAFGATALSFYDNTLLTVKKTGTTFWTDGKSASAWNWSWTLDGEKCDLADKVLTNEHDREVICELLQVKENELIAQSLKSQQYVGRCLIIFFFGAFFMSVRALANARIAQAIYIKSHHSTPTQLELFPQ